MNIWKEIEKLGITDDMPIYKQKSTQFFNIAMRIFLIGMVIISCFMFLIMDMIYVPIGLIAGLPILGFSLFLNYKGKVNISVFFTSIFFPIYFIVISLFAKSHGEALEPISYMLPRVGIIVMTIISFSILGFDNIKTAFSGTIVGLLTFFFFDHIHILFGLGIDKVEFHRSDFELIIYIIGGILMFFILISTFMQRINSQYEKIVVKQKDDIEKQNEKLNQQNEEIKTQRDQIEIQRDTVIKQKDKIEKNHLQINQSIDYATRLQTSILPKEDILIRNISDYFILFKPKDKVSGDFYWWTQINDYTIITAADCTGHGVPGAFMSMLGVSFLREIVNKELITQPNIILDRLRNEIINALKQEGIANEQKDGMDMALITINNKTKEMQYAGAYNPLYLIRKGELIEFKANKMPVAIHTKMNNFTLHETQLQKKDKIYLFSDGYVDQFGGPNERKFLSKSFKKLLLKLENQPMKEQKEILNNTIEAWRGSINQIDDIVIIGIEI